MKYHVDVWLKPDLSAEQIKKELKDLEVFLAEGDDGKVSFRSESLGKRRLAYKIKTYTEGFYYHLDLEAPEAKIASFATSLNRNGSVLRYLLIKVKSEKLKVKS